MTQDFQQLDDLVLHLKGLVLVQQVREQRGADPAELQLYTEAIDNLRMQLADFVRGVT
jgi:hypothetical protein